MISDYLSELLVVFFVVVVVSLFTNTVLVVLVKLVLSACEVVLLKIVLNYGTFEHLTCIIAICVFFPTCDHDETRLTISHRSTKTYSFNYCAHQQM